MAAFRFALLFISALTLWKSTAARSRVVQPPIAQLESVQRTTQWYNEKTHWRFNHLSKTQLKKVSSLVNINRLKNQILPNILRVRTPGSAGSRLVRELITNIANGILGWTVENDSFANNITDPHGRTALFSPVTFTNVIATHNPGAKRRLVLACHYDSKITPAGFLGATDSAVPCSMMLEIAIALRSYLSALNRQNDLTLELIFFDGEEAFYKWSKNDSLYGSRHLSQLWQSTPWPPYATTKRNRLDSIDLLVVLDLLGTSNPKFYNSVFVYSTHFNELARIEKSLFGSRSFFQSDLSLSLVEDDHLPFYDRGVPVLHVIPSPFPKSWHTLNDNLRVIDLPTVEKLTKIFAVFVAEYMHMNV